MDKFGFWSVLLVVFVAEIPCLLRTMALQMHNKGIWNVIWGTTAGNAMALVFGVVLAQSVRRYMPEAWLTYLEHGASVMLIILGVYLLFSGHD